MSDTPRSDEEEDVCRDCRVKFVSVSFAQELERELAAVTRERGLFYVALDHLARLGNEPCLGNSLGNQIAQAALGGQYIAEVEQEQKKRNADVDLLTRERDEARKDAVSWSDAALAATGALRMECNALRAEIELLQSLRATAKLQNDTNAELRAEVERLRGALQRIEKWFGEFPTTGKYWDEPDNTRPMSYASAFGSNGERDYMRGIARAALQETKP